MLLVKSKAVKLLLATPKLVSSGFALKSIEVKPLLKIPRPVNKTLALKSIVGVI